MGCGGPGLWLAMALGACTPTSASPATPGDSALEASVICPEAEPVSLAPCALVAGTQCTYGDRCMPSVFVCDGRTWDDVTPSTKPPPPCPTTLPPNGSTCAACATAYRCNYNVDCALDGGAAGIGTCAGGHWLVGAVDCGD